MDTFLSALVVFALVVAAMAVGVILGNRAIKGSCGGLGAMRDELGQPMCECGAGEGDACAGGRDRSVYRPRLVPARVSKRTNEGEDQLRPFADAPGSQGD